MRKNLLLLTIAALLSLNVQAQFRYIFKDTTTAYVPLAGATSLNGTDIWDEEDYAAPMPFTWTIDSTLPVTQFNLALSFPAVLESINFSNGNGFLFGDMDIADRGTLNGTASLSPIRYLTTGTSPARIFKVELANAGFFEEFAQYGTANDSFSLQIWVYETSNIVELHYGPSKISHATDYFFSGSGPLVSYIKNIDFATGSSGTFYHLNGNAASPGMDSAFLPNFPVSSLTSWPASGKVYRYTPRAKGCTLPVANFTAGTPAGQTVQYTYTGTTPVDSVRWTFGDGTNAALMNPSHTFPAGGPFNVCVTAYNSCGNNMICKQQALAIGSISTLGNNVQVYPNPAGNTLTIAGLQAGNQATILSVFGQQLLSTTLTGSKQAIDISALPVGTYVLLLSGNDGTTGSVRFVKQ